MAAPFTDATLRDELAGAAATLEDVPVAELMRALGRVRRSPGI